jgi:hypothetical protein
VLPPSIHPDSGQPYRWDNVETPIVAPPAWLARMLRPPAPRIPTSTPRTSGFATVDSIADWFTANHTWGEILTGWSCVHGDGEADGSGWRRPGASSPLSATIRHGCLFVYSTETPFQETENGDVQGYTKFRAWAVLEHHGDLSAAARAARQQKQVAA